MIPYLLNLALEIVLIILNMLIVVIIVQVVISWLVAFEITSRRNPIIDTIWRFTGVVTEPLLRPIRRIIPPVSGFDFSPMVLLLIIYIIQRLLPMLVLGPW
ncbi:MAG: YggT family protein [Pseudomonadota bacterium]